MGQKVHPVAFRVGVNRAWSSRWFSSPRSFREYLREDVILKQWLRKRLRRGLVTEIVIDRLSGGKLLITIRTARPGLLIGRGGGGIEEIRKAVRQKISELRNTTVPQEDIRLEVEEVENPDANAAILAQSVAEQLERRMSYRRVLQRTLERALAAKGVLGAKIAVGGRLGGSEMKRREWIRGGRVPLQTLRSHIDYAQEEAKTTWGTIGVKVWLYKGEIFEERRGASSTEQRKP
jgi:small subunit ribosomal protein S3